MRHVKKMSLDKTIKTKSIIRVKLNIQDTHQLEYRLSKNGFIATTSLKKPLLF
jgi:hypothetical protein